MHIRILETSVWVARLGSIIATASKLHITQAAVSGRMAALEADLGCVLFERHGRLLRLSPAGQRLLYHAEHILHVEHELRAELAVPTVLRGRVRLGVMESIIYTWFPLFLQQLQKEHPNVELELTVESSRRLHELLKRGLIDVALQTDPVIEKGIRNAPIGKFKMAWMMAAGVDPAPATLAELLENWTVVTFPRHSQPHLFLLELLEQQGLELRPRIHFVSSIAAGLQLLQAGDCVGVMPSAVFRTQIKQKQLYNAVHYPPLPDMQLVASWRPEPVFAILSTIIELSQHAMDSYAALHQDAIASGKPAVLVG